jgi:hypothetical protein
LRCRPDQEYRFLDFCEKNGWHGVKPRLPERAFEDTRLNKDLVFDRIVYRYTGNAIMWAASFIFCLLVALVKPIADVLIFLFLFPVRNMGKILPAR